MTGSTAELVRNSSRRRSHKKNKEHDPFQQSAPPAPAPPAPASEADEESMSGSVFGSTFELVRTGSRNGRSGSVGTRGGIADVSIA